MNEFLNSLKEDLLDRRMLALVAALTVTLVAALAYAVLGGGGSSSTPPVAAQAPTTHLAGIAVSQAPANPNLAVAETTNGSNVQRAGKNAHDPFKPLVKPKPKVPAKKAASKSTKPAATSKPGTGGTTPTTPPKPAPKPQTVYHVSALFGVVPAGSPLGNPTLTPQLTAYQSLKPLTPLPSSKQALARFLGVTSGGKSAVFSLGETIIHGSGVCIPSNAQCQAIALKATQNEQLEYLAPNGEVVTYELRLVNITSSTASAASLKNGWRNSSKAARELLGKAGMQAVTGLLFSQSAGVLVPAPRRASGPRARFAVGYARPRT